MPRRCTRSQPPPNSSPPSNNPSPTPSLSTKRRTSRPHKPKHIQWADLPAKSTNRSKQAAVPSRAKTTSGPPPSTPNPPRTSRQAPPKPIHLSWGPSNVRQRVTIKRAAAAAAAKEIEPPNGLQQLAAAAAAVGEEEDEDEDESDPDTLREIREEEAYEEWQDQPYPYRVRATLKAMTGSTYRIKWSNKIGTADWIRGEFDIDLLNTEIGDAMEQHHFEETLVSTMAWIKSDAPKAKRQRIELKDLLWPSWTTNIEGTLLQEWRRFPGYPLEVQIECIGIVNHKRPVADIDSPIRSPARRRTRTVQQEEQHAHRRDTNETAGDFSEQLIERWICTSDKCLNQRGFCFIPYTGQHYSLNTTQKKSWARCIASTKHGASFETPPQPLYDFLMGKQGPVSAETRAPIAKAQKDDRKDRMERLMELQFQQVELQLTRDIAGSFGSAHTNSQPHQPHQSQWTYCYECVGIG